MTNIFRVRRITSVTEVLRDRLT